MMKVKILSHPGNSFRQKKPAYLTIVPNRVSSKEYGRGAGPYKKFVAPVKLPADHMGGDVAYSTALPIAACFICRAVS